MNNSDPRNLFGTGSKDTSTKDTSSKDTSSKDTST